MSSDCVEFVLNGVLQRVSRPEPTLSLLRFLREQRHLTGTKEGCAEGDCGACTIAVGTLNAGGRLRFTSANACVQPLVNVHGKTVVTVEHLSAASEHPLQRHLADDHASQCGFCTPGFVMSAATYLSCQTGAPQSDDIAAALTGNLCRCTGYRPIVEAVQASAHTLAAQCRPALQDDVPPGVKDRLSEARTRPLFWATPESNVSSPVTTGELEDVLREHPGAILVAGATDVGVAFNKRFVRPTGLVFLDRIDSLKQISYIDDPVCTDETSVVKRPADARRILKIGAMATWVTLIDQLGAHFPSAAALLLRFASPPIRNVATIGGNIATGSPVGDSIPLLLVLDAELELRSHRGQRSIPLNRFYTGYRSNILEADEYIASVLVPVGESPDLSLGAFKASKRFHQDISAVSGAFRLQINRNGCSQQVRVAFGGMAETARRAYACEKVLEDAPLTAKTIERALEAIDESFAPISDMRGSARYRQSAARSMLLRYLLGATGASEASTHPTSEGLPR